MMRYLVFLMLLLFFTNCKKEQAFKSSYTALQSHVVGHGGAYWDKEGSIKKVIVDMGGVEPICCSFFEKTPDLEELYIRHSEIKGLNKAITRLKKLKVLHLDLKFTLEDISLLNQLPQLEVLYIRNKAYTSLEAIKLNWAIFQNLRSLTVSYNDDRTILDTNINVSEPTTVPSDIFKLPNLEQLHIDGWNLSAFPAEIVALKNLHTLSMRTYVDNVLQQQAAAEVFQELLKTMPLMRFFKLHIDFPYFNSRNFLSPPDYRQFYYAFYDVILTKDEMTVPLFFWEMFFKSPYDAGIYPFYYIDGKFEIDHYFEPICVKKQVQTKDLYLENHAIWTDYYKRAEMKVQLTKNWLNQEGDLRYHLFAVQSCPTTPIKSGTAGFPVKILRK